MCSVCPVDCAHMTHADFLENCVRMQGLKEFPSIVIVPMMQISWTLFSIVSGGIYFKEYRTFTLLSGFMFSLGVLVWCLIIELRLERLQLQRYSWACYLATWTRSARTLFNSVSSNGADMLVDKVASEAEAMRSCHADRVRGGLPTDAQQACIPALLQGLGG